MPQPDHPTVLIPGPVEFDDAVLNAMNHPSESHVGPEFISIFGSTLTMVRQILNCSDPSAQPFIISGSGTLGWDQVAANVARPGDKVLVLHTGYFADSFASCLECYDAIPTQLVGPIGSRPTLDQIESEIRKTDYDMITITHVDTSTGVLSDIEAISKLVRSIKPEMMIVVDAVCSVGCEPIYFDDWDLDIVLTASQKAIGCPAGLSILLASGRAMNRYKSRPTRPKAYFASWDNWTPIMKNYESEKPSYFATPSLHLIRALHTALSSILAFPLETTFEAHRVASDKIKSGIEALGLQQLAQEPTEQAHGMTAVYWPKGIVAADVLPNLASKGIIFAGGLHKQIASQYFRIGHMGVSARDLGRHDLDRALAKLADSLTAAGYTIPAKQ